MRSVLGAVGRVLVTLGLLLLLFVAYQLWGTGIYQARAQNDLEQQFNQSLDRGAAPTTTAPTATTQPRWRPPTTLAPLTVPPEGDAVARIGIPKIGVDQYVVEGVNVDDLRKGPGHYPSTQLPGHEGNSAIAGHRTTYGAPFGDLDQLDPGDEINVTTVQGKFLYKVVEQRVVDPSEVSVLDPSPDPAQRRPSARHADAHDLQPEVLRRAAPHHPGAARASRRPGAAAAADPDPAGPARRRPSAGCRANRRRGRPRSCGGSSPRRSGCCGGCSSTVTRAGRRGSSARFRSSPRCSCVTCTSSDCCRRTTDRRGHAASITTRRSARRRCRA